MISMMVVFYLFMVLFAVIGATRGWAKEMLVTFSAILALSLIAVVEYLMPFTKGIIPEGSATQYWFRTVVVLTVVFFGYQSPKFPQLAKAAGRRDAVQETLLGLIMGILNGYMVVGTLWTFLHQASYLPIKDLVIYPDANIPLAQTTLDALSVFPPALLLQPGSYLIYPLVVLAFIFVIVVFV